MSNDQQSTNDQSPMKARRRNLVIGIWSFVGHWTLVIAD
jgi:hypothetical protein